MSDYSIVTVEPRHTAVVKANVGFADLRNAELSARAKIAGALPSLQIGAVGDSFTLFRMPKDGTMHLEPGVIVTRPFDSDGDVVHSQLPSGRAAMHVLVGPFERLPQAWPALFSWCANAELKLEGAFWQIYGPTAVDPAKQETTLYALLA